MNVFGQNKHVIKQHMKAKGHLRARQYHKKQSSQQLIVNDKISTQFNTIERFLDVSRVVLNRIQAFIIIYRKSYIEQIQIYKH